MKKIIKLVIIFAAFTMALPAAANAEPTTEKYDSASLMQRLDELSYKVDSLTGILNKGNAHEPSVSAADTKIDLNFDFKHNRTTFNSALEILLIGFSIVFAVMIVFIFVSTGIDKLFPYKKEE
ncbi:MAG: hypothetical protein LBS01_09265 [Prevotellaceae bacterium]|jgi:hypothetical protein|nr:hypothetical protein [Prevotellaceae bacterium]